MSFSGFDADDSAGLFAADHSDGRSSGARQPLQGNFSELLRESQWPEVWEGRGSRIVQAPAMGRREQLLHVDAFLGVRAAVLLSRAQGAAPESLLRLVAANSCSEETIEQVLQLVYIECALSMLICV